MDPSVTGWHSATAFLTPLRQGKGRLDAALVRSSCIGAAAAVRHAGREQQEAGQRHLELSTALVAAGVPLGLLVAVRRLKRRAERSSYSCRKAAVAARTGRRSPPAKRASPRGPPGRMRAPPGRTAGPPGRTGGPGIAGGGGGAAGQAADAGPQRALSPAERFAQRRAQWSELKQSGSLELFSDVEDLAMEDEKDVRARQVAADRQMAKLDSLAESGDVAALLTRTDELGETLWDNRDEWAHAISCLCKAGRLADAWCAVQKCGDKYKEKASGKHEFHHKKAMKAHIATPEEPEYEETDQWPFKVAGAAQVVGEAALALNEEDEILDNALFDEISARLEKEGHCKHALEVRVQYSLACAELAVRAQQKERDRRKGARAKAEAEGQELPAVVEEDESQPGEDEVLFERALQNLDGIIRFAQECSAKAIDVRGLDVKSWNTLLRLVSKSRKMPYVFRVLDAMEAAHVSKDAETYEFVARAAVVRVQMNAIVDSFETMPPPLFPEIVFLGRSNVGKSSLVNALLHRAALAPVAAMPGHTTRFHFYDINKEKASFPRLTMVDVPGLGVAVTSQEQHGHWKSTLLDYLKQRGPVLRGVFHLVSGTNVCAQRNLSGLDLDIMRTVQQTNAEYTLVITKADLLGDPRGHHAVRILDDWLNEQNLSIENIVPSSTKSRLGRDTLWRRLWNCLDPDNTRFQEEEFDILKAHQKADELVEGSSRGGGAGMADVLLPRLAELHDEGWEHAMLRLSQSGNLAPALQALKERVATGVPGRAMRPAELRISVVLGEVALSGVGGEGQTPENEEAQSRALVKELLDMLVERQSFGVAQELKLELAAADAALAAAKVGREEYKSFLVNSMEKVQGVVEKCSDWGKTPWSIDRWNRLLQNLSKAGAYSLMRSVWDTMDALTIKASDDVQATFTQSGIKNAAVAHKGKALKGLPEVKNTEVVFAGTWTPSPNFRLSAVDTLLALYGGDSLPPHGNLGAKTSVASRLLDVNTGDDVKEAALPRLTLTEVNVVPRDGRDAEAYVAGWRSDLLGYLERPRDKPIVLTHVIEAPKYVEHMRELVPNRGEAVNNPMSKSQITAAGKQVQLDDFDKAVVEAAAQAKVPLLVFVADADELSKEIAKDKRKTRDVRAHPVVINSREEAFKSGIRRLARTLGAECQNVVMTDSQSKRGCMQYWMSLWEQLSNGPSEEELLGTASARP
eukprot:TRINITY_DN9429_c0_g2_i1.p1 TRINITY_DN9429_c0_g2~~TRINITY_DN9429_c0_g2_i1.p1  ORF type:complete len:1217 (+),score=346.42 TRINITY_DN9429_c0_g2_i1:53-3652(+)